jgi:LCP family protein required for cell wall assembly
MVAGRVLATLGLAAFIALIVYIARIGAVPTWWMGGGVVIFGAITLAVVIPLWRTRLPEQPRRYTLLAGLTVLGLVASYLTYSVAHDIKDFFYGIQPPAEQTVTYDVIALVGHADGIESVAGETVGQLAIDPNKPAADAKLAEIVQVEYEDYPDLAALTDALIGGDVQAALLDRAYLALYDDIRPEFASQYKVLHSFEVVARPGAVATPRPTPTPTTPSATPTPRNGFIIYISGIDQYGDISFKGRSDVNILAAVNPDTRTILLVNTPRDFYVQLHGTTGLKDKLTHAGVYGIDMSVTTLEDLYGIDIDHYLRVNFNSVVKLVDLVGGVDVYSEYAFTGAHGYSFQQGYNTVNGEQALSFARERYSFATGDRQRGVNQERVIEALIRKMMQPSELLRFGSILEAMQNGIATDMPGDKMMSIVNDQLSSGGDWTIERVSVNGSDANQPTYSYNQLLYVMIPDMATVESAKAKIDQVLAG